MSNTRKYTIFRYSDNKYFPIAIYSLISFLIIYQTSHFNEYYLLILDMIFPIKNMLIGYIYGFSPLELGGYIPIIAISKVGMVNEWLLQRLYLFLTIFLSGISMHSLIDIKSLIPKYFAGIFFAINPFVYIRFLTGQWTILLAYSIIPFTIKLFLNILDHYNKKDLIKLMLLATIIGSLSSHVLVLLVLIYLILAIFKLYQIKNEKTEIRRILSSLNIFMILFLLSNIYWLLPLEIDKDIRINNIGNKDYWTFAPKIESNIYGWFEIAAMYGFWREGYTYAKDFIPGWQILYLIILSLTIIGFLAYYKDEKIGYIVKAMAIIGIIGFILASGIKGPFGDQIYWLFDNTILKGFRDSHKFVSMMVLAYAVLGGLGIEKLSRMKN